MDGSLLIRYASLISGLALIFLAIVGYQTELGRVRDALVSGWVAVGVASERAETKHARWIRALSRRSLAMIRWLFGDRVLSLRGFWVCLMLSRASQLIWLVRSLLGEVLRHEHLLPMDALEAQMAAHSWSMHENLYGPGVTAIVKASAQYSAMAFAFVLAAALPTAMRDLRTLRRDRGRALIVLIGGAQAIQIMFWEVLAAAGYMKRGLWYPPFAMLITPMLAVPVNMVLVAIVRWAARRALGATLDSPVRWFVVGATVAFAPMYLLSKLTSWVWHWRPPGDSISMTLVHIESSREGTFSLASLFLAFGFALLLHRAAWGALSRPIYALHNLTLSRIALASVGALLLAAYDPHVGEIARKIVFSVIGLRLPGGGSP